METWSSKFQKFFTKQHRSIMPRDVWFKGVVGLWTPNFTKVLAKIIYIHSSKFVNGYDICECIDKKT